MWKGGGEMMQVEFQDRQGQRRYQYLFFGFFGVFFWCRCRGRGRKGASVKNLEVVK